MFRLYFVFITCFSLTTFGQTLTRKKATFQGTLFNSKASSVKMLVNDFLGIRMDSIAVNHDGTYSYSQVLQQPVNVGVILGNRPLYFYMYPGDLIRLNFDARSETIKNLSSNSYARTQQLRFDLDNLLEMSIRRDSIFGSIIKSGQAPSQKYDAVRRYYEDELKDLIQKRNTVGKEIYLYIDELYFTCINLLQRLELYDYNRLVPKPHLMDNGVNYPGPDHYTLMSKALLQKSPQYRLFIFESIRSKTSDRDAKLAMKFGDNKKFAPWIDYLKSENIKDDYIKEWYITYSIIFSSDYYDIQEVKKISNDFLQKCKNKEFAIALNRYWSIYSKQHPKN